jgi:hypothetical protein
MGSVTRTIPYVCFGAAAVVALLFSLSDDEWLEHVLASCFAPLVGLALAFWGYAEIRAGEIRGRRRYVRRATQPVLFWSMVWARRLLPALILVPAGFWLYFTRAP